MMDGIAFGFVGTGTITEAMVTGMMQSPLPIRSIRVSPRNGEVARRLAARFDRVVVAADNQAVVEGCDIVFLAVRPQVAGPVLRELRVAPRQRIVSLIAATDAASIEEWIAGAHRVVRAIPLPFVADRDGVTAIFPPDPDIGAVFDALGHAVACETKEEFDLLAAASALMGTYFGLQERISGWLAENGMGEEKARAYLAPLFASLARVANETPQAGFARLRQDYSTAGGLNEQVFGDFDRRGGPLALTSALDAVLKRIRAAE